MQVVEQTLFGHDISSWRMADEEENGIAKQAETKYIRAQSLARQDRPSYYQYAIEVFKLKLGSQEPLHLCTRIR